METRLAEGQIVEFVRKTQLSYIRPLGRGGTGETHLFRDLATGKYCVIKKFAPAAGNDPFKCYERFEREAEILRTLSHPHIVRFLDCYLYPEQRYGYLQMEYVEGVEINHFAPGSNAKGWNEVFLDAIDAFALMEKKGVLHRDVRPSNFLITTDGNLKIIDFGFSKTWESESTLADNSLMLNWPATKPAEVSDCRYDRATELYYLGRMFEQVINGDPTFAYYEVLRKMTQRNPKERYSTFLNLTEDLSPTSFPVKDFTWSEKQAYNLFADSLIESLGVFRGELVLATDPDQILKDLENVIEASALETFVQDSSMLINCFVKSGYTYYRKPSIPSERVSGFHNLLKSSNPNRRKVILRNLAVRLGQVEREDCLSFDDDIPF